MRRSSTKRISTAVRREAEGWQLGPLQRAYHLGGLAGLYRVLGLFCLLFGAALIGIFFFFYNSVFSWWSLWQAALILGIGLCWLLIGAWILLSAVFTQREHIYIFAKGMIYRKRVSLVVHWNQVEKLWQRGASKDEPPIFTLQFKGNLRIVLPGELPGIQALYRFLEELVTRREVARGYESYKAGHVLDFGPLVLSKQGLMVKGQGELLPWGHFTRLSENPTVLRIYCYHDDYLWASLNSSEICNRKACVELVEQIKTEHSYQERLKRGSSPGLWQQLPQIDEFEQGSVVTFGTLRISKQGVELVNSEGMLPWDDIACIGVAENAIIIRRQGALCEWQAIPIWAVTDLTTLKELVNYIVNRKIS